MTLSPPPGYTKSPMTSTPNLQSCRRCDGFTEHELVAVRGGGSRAECMRCRESDLDVKRRGGEVRPSSSTSARQRPGLDLGSALALGAGILIIAAAFMPWLISTGDVEGGVEHAAHRWVLVIVAAAIIVTAATQRGGAVRVVWALLAVVTMVLCLIGLEAAHRPAWGKLSVGAGPYLGLLGAAMAAVAALVKR